MPYLGITWIFFPDDSSSSIKPIPRELWSLVVESEMDWLSSLEEQARDLMKQGIAQSTRRTYETAERLFLEFCNRSPFPVSASTRILFVAELAQMREHSTIRVYLAGVRHCHIMNVSSQLAPLWDI